MTCPNPTTGTGNFDFLYVENISNQKVPLIYFEADEQSSVESEIPGDQGGVLDLFPNKSFEIEEDRLDSAQLEELVEKRLILTRQRPSSC